MLPSGLAVRGGGSFLYNMLGARWGQGGTKPGPALANGKPGVLREEDVAPLAGSWDDELKTRVNWHT